MGLIGIGFIFLIRFSMLPKRIFFSIKRLNACVPEKKNFFHIYIYVYAFNGLSLFARRTHTLTDAYVYQKKKKNLKHIDGMTPYGDIYCRRFSAYELNKLN